MTQIKHRISLKDIENHVPQVVKIDRCLILYILRPNFKRKHKKTQNLTKIIVCHVYKFGN